LGPPLARLPGSPDGALPDPVHAPAAPPVRWARSDRVDGGVHGQRVPDGDLAVGRAADRTSAAPRVWRALHARRSAVLRGWPSQRAGAQLPDADRRRLDPAAPGLIAEIPARSITSGRLSSGTGQGAS